MRGKLFLLAVVCVSFVQVRGDDNLEKSFERGLFGLKKPNDFVDEFKSGIQSSTSAVEKTPEQELEEAILEGLSVVDSVHKLTLNILLKQWTHLNDIRKIMAKNSTDYTASAEADKGRFKKALYNVAYYIKEEARDLENTKIIVQCIERVEQMAKDETESRLKTVVAEIWHLNYEFNVKYTEYPFLMVEEVLKYPYNETTQSIKRCENTTCVDTEVKRYKNNMSDFYNSYLKQVTGANADFITYQQDIHRFYRETTKELEKIYLTAVADMRTCLYVTKAVVGKLLGFS